MDEGATVVVLADGSPERLIVALDVATYDEAARLVDVLSPHVGWFKVGSVLFTREGPRVCGLVADAGAKLFLDLKFHDIPNTVRGAVASAIQVGADMLTLHVAGGEAMLRAAAAARDEAEASDVTLVGVTVLTHLEIDDFRSLFASSRSPEETVLGFARLARDAGLDGVVASAREARLIKEHLGSAFTVVTPGIRLPEGAKDDQARVVTPRQAIDNGADYIVVGRPITSAPDAPGACQKILEDMIR